VSLKVQAHVIETAPFRLLFRRPLKVLPTLNVNATHVPAKLLLPPANHQASTLAYNDVTKKVRPVPASLPEDSCHIRRIPEDAEPFLLSYHHPLHSLALAQRLPVSATSFAVGKLTKASHFHPSISVLSRQHSLMATLSGPFAPRHPSPFRKGQQVSRPSAATTAHSPTASSSGSDPSYGHEQTAMLCGHFVSHLFACPDVPHSPAPSSSTRILRLDHVIATALWTHSTRPEYTQRCIPPSGIGWNTIEPPLQNLSSHYASSPALIQFDSSHTHFRPRQPCCHD
jgi:hypothetical protein